MVGWKEALDGGYVVQIPILIQPMADGRFRVRAAEPFSLACEGSTVEEATDMLRKQIEESLENGASLSVMQVNGPANGTKVHFDFEPIPEYDWIFQTMRETIEENRAREEAGR